MDRTMAPAPYVAEDGLVGINLRRSPWSCQGLMPHCRGMSKQKGLAGWVGENPHRRRGRGDGIGCLWIENWERI